MKANKLSVILTIILAGCAGVESKQNGWREHFDIGKLEFSKNNIANAEKEFLAALTYAQKEPQPSLHQAATENNLAVIYVSQNRQSEAKPFIYSALKTFENKNYTENEYYFTALLNAGSVEIYENRSSDAEVHYRKAIEISKSIKIDNQQLLNRATDGLVASLCLQGRVSEAKEAGKSLHAYCKVVGPR